MYLPPVAHFCFVFIALLLTVLVCIRKGKLTLAGAGSALLMGLVIFLGTGYTGISMLAAFFLLATFATSHKKQWKATLSGEQKHAEKRNAAQVFANGGAATALGITSLLDPAHAPVYTLLLGAALASATADTLSSELGVVYGRNTFHALTFRKEARGPDGVISIEGTLIGAAGTLVIAGIYWVSYRMETNTYAIVMGGIAGNYLDSVLGAKWERKGVMGNNWVNFWSTVGAVGVAIISYLQSISNL